MSTRVRAGAVLAAGEGSRLARDGFAVSKPLVPVAGVPLLGHVLGHFAAVSLKSVAVVLREGEKDCADWARARFPLCDLRIHMQSTASSLETFRAASSLLPPGPLLVSTVDAFCLRVDFLRFWEEVAATPVDTTVLAVTPHIDDERPLWVRTTQEGGVLSVGEEPAEVVTAGLYVFSERARSRPISPALARLRDYLAWLCQEGEPMRALTIPIVVDIDRARDVEAAERLARTADAVSTRESA